jgi:hypothetical protein
MDSPELNLCLRVNRELQRQLSEIRLGLFLAASSSHREVLEQLSKFRKRGVEEEDKVW